MFNPGDVVRQSGGPSMTVERAVDQYNTQCVWYVGDSTVPIYKRTHRGNFLTESLELIHAAQIGQIAG